MYCGFVSGTSVLIWSSLYLTITIFATKATLYKVPGDFLVFISPAFYLDLNYRLIHNPPGQPCPQCQTVPSYPPACPSPFSWLPPLSSSSHSSSVDSSSGICICISSPYLTVSVLVLSKIPCALFSDSASSTWWGRVTTCLVATKLEALVKVATPSLWRRSPLHQRHHSPQAPPLVRPCHLPQLTTKQLPAPRLPNKAPTTSCKPTLKSSHHLTASLWDHQGPAWPGVTRQTTADKELLGRPLPDVEGNRHISVCQNFWSFQEVFRPCSRRMKIGAEKAELL